LRSSPRESGIGLVLIAAGLPFYFHWKGRIMRERAVPPGGDPGSGNP
jgi:hypothetical protein